MANINGNEIYFGIIGTVKGAGGVRKMTATGKITVAGYFGTLVSDQAEATNEEETEG